MSSDSPFELPTDRLATVDKAGKRLYLYPAEVKGRFRTLRNRVHFILIVFFLVLPWIKIHGHPAILLDVAAKKFSILGIRFWAHDAPMLVFIFGGAALTLGLVTAIWGRIWCGWACPQTVFVDSVFRTIEKWAEGDHLARRILDAEKWSGKKLFKKALKWSLFLAATLIIAHSFIAYFVGAEELARMIRKSPAENPVSFGIMAFISAALLFNFGWFREQLCTVLCPYGRFQSLLMDDHSLVVAYDAARGEPRKVGDCVNCYRCVRVCPTGIDIRRGNQLECVGCTACIDACNDVMARLKKPLGLIRYESAVGLNGGVSHKLRGRTLAYTVLLVGLLIGLFANLWNRNSIEATFVRATGVPYQEIQTLGKSEIINRFKADLSNQSFEDIELNLNLAAEYSTHGISVILIGPSIRIPAGRKAAAEFFVKFPKALLSNGKALIKVNISGPSGVLITEELNLVGPYL
jgi:cytochrome c oxidase accessory protein FixG